MLKENCIIILTTIYNLIASIFRELTPEERIKKKTKDVNLQKLMISKHHEFENEEMKTGRTVREIINDLLEEFKKFTPGNIIKTEVIPPNSKDVGKTAFTLDNVFTPKECLLLIELSETIGFGEALTNTGNGQMESQPDFRNNRRCILDHEIISNEFYRRVKKFLPEKFMDHELCGMNERLRFLKYGIGQFFKSHVDGKYVRPDGSETSYITFQFYLNQDFEGGCTTFLHKSDETEHIPVLPVIGRVLIFDHKIRHEGSVLVKGTKYTIRTDFMYKMHVMTNTMTAEIDNQGFTQKGVTTHENYRLKELRCAFDKDMNPVDFEIPLTKTIKCEYSDDMTYVGKFDGIEVYSFMAWIRK